MEPNKRQYLFGPYKNDYMKYDELSIYSVTPYCFSNKVVTIMEKYIGTSNVIVTDACACIGCDTINLCKTFKHVNCIEVNPTRYGYLNHNLRTQGVDNFSTFHGDCISIIPKLAQDVIYFDVPWPMGKDYKTLNKCSMSLEGKDMSWLCDFALIYANHVFFKVPNNFDFNEFRQRISAATHYRDQCLGKFYIIYVRATCSSKCLPHTFLKK